LLLGGLAIAGAFGIRALLRPDQQAPALGPDAGEQRQPVVEVPVEEETSSAPKIEGYSYTLTAGTASVTYDGMGDLCAALHGRLNVYRRAVHETIGDERPTTFTFTVDGVTVRADRAGA
jgi:hypothetical protein